MWLLGKKAKPLRPGFGQINVAQESPVPLTFWGQLSEPSDFPP